MPLTVAVGFPSSAFTLYLYTKSIKNFGAKITLRLSNIACILIFLFIFIFSGRLKNDLGSQIMIVCFYAFREIYVSLLSSQQWAFISTTLDRTTSSYLVSFSGIVSIASAVGGCTVVQLVNVGGVRGLLLTTLIAVVLGLICAELAHQTSEVEQLQKVNKFSDQSESTTTASSATSSSSATPSTSGHHQSSQASQTAQHHHSSHTKSVKSGFWLDSWNLIWKNKILQILFFEAVTHQFCSNMLNLMFHNGLRHSTEMNEIKAKMVGRFFATVNVIASLLQCFFFPLIMSPTTLPTIMRYLPFIVLTAVLLGVFHPGTISVMLGFGTIKILEYSCMHSASEMIYMPLGYELRYVGKELIKFFGQKLGKSISSVLLSVLISRLKLSLALQSLLGAILTMIWGVTIYQLADFLAERERTGTHVTFCDDVVDHTGVPSSCSSNRTRTKSEELRLNTSRSMPLFELPDDEEDEAIFFKDIGLSDDQQPEDFFYGQFQDNDSTRSSPSPSAATDPMNQPEEFVLPEESSKFATNLNSSAKLRRRGSPDFSKERDKEQEDEEGTQKKEMTVDYFTFVFRTLKATPIISMFIPGRFFEAAEKH